MSRNRVEVKLSAEEIHAQLGHTTVLSVDEINYLKHFRPGDVLGVLNGTLSPQILIQDLAQDRENRYFSGSAGLYQGYE
jgi:hypothetical protein